MLKIWGRVNSVNVKKALWAAEELGLKYQRIDAGMEHGVNTTPEYRRMNPTGLVPPSKTTASRCGSRTRSCAISPPSMAPGRSGHGPQGARVTSTAGWMDAQLLARVPAPGFLALVRTPPEKRDQGRSPEAVKSAARCSASSTRRSPARNTSRGRLTMATSPSLHVQLGCGCLN